MRRASRAAVFSSLVVGLGPFACADTGADQADDQGDDQADDQAGESDGESGGETGDAVLGDRCEATDLIVEAPTRLEASLRNAGADPDGIAEQCGLTGPTVFVEVTQAARADLSVLARGRGYPARFAVLRPGCTAEPSRILACGDGLPVTITDIGPDVELLIAVGIDQADPALALPAPELEGEADLLDFELRLEVRAVLGEHASCSAGLGRCEAGTVCLAEVEADSEDGVLVERCRRPAADSCVAPGQLVVPSPGAAASFEIAWDEPHSDAHAHACTGWRRPERVEQLVLPAGLGETARLEVHADDPRVGLALRGASCEPEHALGCASALGTGEGTSLSLAEPGQLAALAVAGSGPLLFIELPPEPLVPIVVSVELFD